MTGMSSFFSAKEPKKDQVTATSASSNSGEDSVEAAPAVHVGAKGLTVDDDVEKDAPTTIRAHTDAVDDARVAFLDTFTPEEQKTLVRKLDYRILLTVGVIYLVKQVSFRRLCSAARSRHLCPRNTCLVH